MAQHENENQKLNSFEKFIYDNQKALSYVGIAVLLIVAGYLGWKKFIIEPKEEQAQVDVFQAQMYFENDSFDLALQGDGVNPGFLDIAEDYGMTPTGNLANYYIGIIYLNKGDYESAIEYLKDFDTESDMIGPLAKGAIGDAYSQLNEYETAADYYVEAADFSENNLTTPYFLSKAGLVYMELEEYKQARGVFERIKKDFPNSEQAPDAKKFLGKVDAILK